MRRRARRTPPAPGPRVGFRRRRTLVQPGLGTVGDQPRHREATRSPPARGRFARAGRARSRRPRSRPPAARRGRAPARAPRRSRPHVVARQLGHVVGRRAPAKAGWPRSAARSRRCATSAASCARSRARRGRPGARAGAARRACGPQRDVAVGVAAQVHAEERQRRVGHGVDQRPHEVRRSGRRRR